MKTSEETGKLLPALLEARKAIHPAAKGGENKFDGYHYATEHDWHTAVMPALLANGLILAFSQPAWARLDNRITKKGGTEYVVAVQGIARVMHSSGQWLEVEGWGEGQDRADKATYKSITGMKKYLYSLLFALPTTDDPEADETVGQSEGPGKPVTKPRLAPDTQPDPEVDLDTKAFDAAAAYLGKHCGDAKVLLKCILRLPAAKGMTKGQKDLLAVMADAALMEKHTYSQANIAFTQLNLDAAPGTQLTTHLKGLQKEHDWK